MYVESLYMIIDTHTHLEEVEDLDQALKNAEKAGVIAIITVGSDDQSNKWARAQIVILVSILF